VRECRVGASPVPLGHCEERSDVAIRSPRPYAFAGLYTPPAENGFPRQCAHCLGMTLRGTKDDGRVAEGGDPYNEEPPSFNPVGVAPLGDPKRGALNERCARGGGPTHRSAPTGLIEGFANELGCVPIRRGAPMCAPEPPSIVPRPPQGVIAMRYRAGLRPPLRDHAFPISSTST
jgi:hypothetical protein